MTDSNKDANTDVKQITDEDAVNNQDLKGNDLNNESTIENGQADLVEEVRSRSHSKSRSRSTSVETCIRKNSVCYNEPDDICQDEVIEEKNCEKTKDYHDSKVNENKLEDKSIEKSPAQSEGVSSVSMLSTFRNGAFGGIFATTPLSACIGIELREALGPMNGVLGALLGATASAIFGGIIASLASYLTQNKIVFREMNDIEDDNETELDEDENNDENVHDESEKVKKTSGKTELTEEDINFIMTYTDFTRENVIRWFATFKAECPDCKLDRKKFINFYKKLIPGNSEVKDEFAEAVFIAFDNDNNGYVDFGEFLIAFWIKAKGSVEKKLVWLFDVYDNDKSGFIEMSELSHMLRLVFALKSMKDDPDERAVYVMNLVDLNSDGQLSQSEFVEGCLKDVNLRKLLET